MAQRLTLRDTLRKAGSGILSQGWLYLPRETDLKPDTDCLLVGDEDYEADERGVPRVAIEQGFPFSSLDTATIEDVVQGASLLEAPASDELLVEAFRYYLLHDVYLPSPGAPDPPPAEEFRLILDREFYDCLGEERADVACRELGCTRGAVPLSGLCRVHHFENIMCRPCPFND
jgi:hypothetical protein